MERMNSPSAPVIASIPFDEVKCGFMKDGRGNIIFLMPHGQDTIPFPVLKDGSISQHGDISALQPPGTLVNLINASNIGINTDNLRWTKEKADF